MSSISNNFIFKAINTAINKTPKGLAVTMIVLGSIALLTGAMGLFTQEIDNLHRFRFIPEWASITLLSCGLVNFVWGACALKSKSQNNKALNDNSVRDNIFHLDPKVVSKPAAKPRENEVISPSPVPVSSAIVSDAPKSSVPAGLEPPRVIDPAPHMDFATYQKSRDPSSMVIDEGILGDFYTRDEGITIGEMSASHSQDRDVRLRKDAQPLPSELIESYLPRVFNEYTHPGVGPRGLVFSSSDFMWRGFIESHPSIAFLKKYLPILQKMGIKKIYFEQMFGFSDVAERSNLPYKFYKYYHRVDDETLDPFKKNLVDMAKKYDIEVIGLEVDIGRTFTFNTSEERRLGTTNRFGAALVKKVNEPFVVFVGAAHGKLRREGIPGISEILDCPCIGIPFDDKPPTHVLPGTHRFTSDQYSVDAVLA